MNLIKLEAKFRIVTPLFMSGDDRERAELRAASIRGVLRFWWRALALGHCGGSWEEVQKAEFALFGSSSGGQSRVHLSLSAPEQSKKRCRSGNLLKDRSGNVLGSGGLYLGYGVVQPSDKTDKEGKIINKIGEAIRPYLNAPIEFDLRIYLRPPCRTSASPLAFSDEEDLLEGALKAMGLLGGLGSRSRRGFGSLTLLKLKRNDESKPIYEAPSSVEGYLDNLKDFFQKHVKVVSKVPDYTAFCQDTMVYLLETGEEIGKDPQDPLQLLDKIGQKMQSYRSWFAEKKFRDDHDNMLDALSSPAKAYPHRVAFGLPHNYYFSKQKDKFSKPVVDVVPDQKDHGHDRRASPLFLHIHELSNESFVAVATIFPSIFLPKGEGVLIQRAKQEDNEQDVPRKVLFVKEDWHKELNKFLESEDPVDRRKKRFSSFRIIWPEVAAEESV